MVGTQPPWNSSKWWHLGGKRKKKRRKRVFLFFYFFIFLIWDKSHLTRLVYHRKSSTHTHTRTAECFAISAQFKAPFFTFFPSPLPSPGLLPPFPSLAFAIMLTDSADILWAADRYVISWGETGLSSAGECAAPSSSQADRHAWHFSTLSPW